MYKAGNSVEQVYGGSVIKQGDRTPFGFMFRDENGETVSLKNATVKIKLANEKALLLEKDAVLTDEYTATFSIGQEDITGSGDMRLEFTVTYANGLQEKFPSDDWQRIKITPTLEDIGKTGVAYITFEKMKAEFSQRFDGFQDQLNSIVAESGNSNPEIVQSRTDIDGNSSANLKSRLDSEQIKAANSLGVTLERFPIKTPELDDKARLNRMFAYAVSNNIKAVILPKGTYTLASQWNVTNLSNLMIVGYGATINFTYNADATKGGVIAWYINSSSHLVIEGIKINIVNSSLTKQYTGIQISNSHHIYLRNIDVQNAGWVGISIYDSVIGQSYRITIDHCNIEYCNYGLLSTGDFVHIKNGTYISNHWSKSEEATAQGNFPIWKGSTSNPPSSTESRWFDGITMKGNFWIIQDTIIEDNGQSGIYSGACTHGVIKGCTIKDNWNKGIDLGASKTNGISSIRHISIEGENTIQDNKTGQVHLYKTDYCKVFGNSISVLDRSYEDVAYDDPSTTTVEKHPYIQPAIILNADCVGNAISNNTVIQNYNTVAAIFINSSGTKSTGNLVIDNKISANVKYNINYIDNAVVDRVNGKTIFYGDIELLGKVKNVLTIDRSDATTAFDARNLLSLIGGTAGANNFNQIMSNQWTKLVKADGTPQDFAVGALNATSATLSGVNYFSDSASIRLPRTAQTTEGYIWYDPSDKTVKIHVGGGVIKTIATL